MNLIAEQTAITTQTAGFPPVATATPFGRLVEERRHATAIPESVLFWHYVPTEMLRDVAGQLDAYSMAALTVACRDQVRLLLRDKLPEWLLMGVSRESHDCPAGAVFCLICYDHTREEDARVWLEEIFLPQLAPQLMAAMRECAERMVASTRGIAAAVA